MKKKVETVLEKSSDKEQLKTFFFPKQGLTIRAASREEALEKLPKKKKKEK